VEYPAGCPLDELPATVVVATGGGGGKMHAEDMDNEDEPRCGLPGSYRTVDRVAVEPIYEPCDTCFSTS